MQPRNRRQRWRRRPPASRPTAVLAIVQDCRNTLPATREARMKTHQQRSTVSEIQEMYEIAVGEHGPQARSSKMLKQALECELARKPQKDPNERRVTSASKDAPSAGSRER